MQSNFEFMKILQRRRGNKNLQPLATRRKILEDEKLTRNCETVLGFSEACPCPLSLQYSLSIGDGLISCV